MAPVEVCRIVTPVGNLGFGFDNNGLNTLLRRLAGSSTPTALVLNSSLTCAASGDALPAGLRASYTRDIRKLLRCVSAHRVPLILNVVALDGEDRHVNTIAEMVEELARESPQNLAIVKVNGEQQSPPGQPRAGSSPAPKLERRISPRTIGGVVQTILETAEDNPGFDVLLGTSNSRVVPFMAFTSLCLKNATASVDQHSVSATGVKGGVIHMAKILEEGGVCATPRCAGAVGTLYNDGTFEVSPVGAKSRCTSISVASYMLQSPSRLLVPELGGKLELTFASYEQLADDLTVRVRGSILRRDVESERGSPLTLERPYRSAYFGRITDVSVMSTIDETLSRAKGYVRAQQPHFPAESWDLTFRVYGRNTPEVIIAGEISAISYDTARSVAEIARMATQLGFGLKSEGVEFPDSPISVSDMSA